ncbi:MAG: hypothetical protein KGY81_09445 [Phycisphaerae bacterium]|nr:hypothetical protein [Phycisphaerae bacterium]
MSKPTDKPFDNGRDDKGRFAKGNQGGPGNPYARRVAELRQALIDAIDPDDMKAIAEQLVAEARGGNIRAIREVFDRTLGRPVEADLISRIEALEHLLTENQK